MRSSVRCVGHALLACPLRATRPHLHLFQPDRRPEWWCRSGKQRCLCRRRIIKQLDGVNSLAFLDPLAVQVHRLEARNPVKALGICPGLPRLATYFWSDHQLDPHLHAISAETTVTRQRLGTCWSRTLNSTPSRQPALTPPSHSRAPAIQILSLPCRFDRAVGPYALSTACPA